MNLVNEVLDHLFGDFDIGNNAVAKGANGLDRTRRLAHHQFCVVADRLDTLHPVDRLDRDDRRLIEDDASSAKIDNCVGGSQMSWDIILKKREKNDIPDTLIYAGRRSGPG